MEGTWIEWMKRTWMEGIKRMKTGRRVKGAGGTKPGKQLLHIN
jgi:hypothetical protein